MSYSRLLEKNNNPHFMDQRLLQLQQWLSNFFHNAPLQISPLAGDASFRRYFRIHTSQNSYVAMDAPPTKESIKPFIIIDQTFAKIGLRVPEIFAQDEHHGFLLLSDFGDRLYLNELNEQNVNKLYQKAFESLLVLQRFAKQDITLFPKFTEKKYRLEMNLFVEWYLNLQLSKRLTPVEKKIIEKLFSSLIRMALAQPQVAIHRDYHSRNLLVIEDDGIGILDFQDALWGPITYDLLSLLRDCYINWPIESVDRWVADYYQQLVTHKLLAANQMQQFQQWFDWIGLQRNLKCIGIFSRLNIRDHKPAYLEHIPRIFRYAQTVCQRYPEFKAFNEILGECIEGNQ